MSIFIESLKRLYTSKKISDYKLKEMVKDGKITAKEYEYITN